MSPLRTELGSSSVSESFAVWPMARSWSARCARPRCPSSALLGERSGGCGSSSLACVCTDGPARSGSGHRTLSWLSIDVHLWSGCLLRNGCKALPLRIRAGCETLRLVGCLRASCVCVTEGEGGPSMYVASTLVVTCRVALVAVCATGTGPPLSSSFLNPSHCLPCRGGQSVCHRPGRVCPPCCLVLCGLDVARWIAPSSGARGP